MKKNNLIIIAVIAAVAIAIYYFLSKKKKETAAAAAVPLSAGTIATGTLAPSIPMVVTTTLPPVISAGAITGVVATKKGVGTATITPLPKSTSGLTLMKPRTPVKMPLMGFPI